MSYCSQAVTLIEILLGGCALTRKNRGAGCGPQAGSPWGSQTGSQRHPL